MGNVIIDNRIAQLTEHKRQLLKMKKVDRGDGLKRTNDTISRLKRWNNDLDVADHKKIHKATKMVTIMEAGESIDLESIESSPANVFPWTIKSDETAKNRVVKDTIEAVKDFGKEMTRFANMMTEKEPEGQKEEQIAPLGVQMYNGTLGSFDRQCAKGA